MTKNKKDSKELEQFVTQLMDTISKEDETGHFDAVFKKGVTLKTLKGITEEQMEGVYHLAYQMYNNQKYGEAQSLFRMLCMNDHWDSRYALGLAGCQFMLKKYEDALMTYSLCYQIDPLNPKAPFYAARCHLNLKQYTEAKSGYFAAQEWSRGKPEYAEIFIQAEKMHELMSKKVAQMAAEAES